MRTRSQSHTASENEDLDIDLLLAATSEADPVVQRLKRRLRSCITFRPKAGLNAWRNQMLAVLQPSGGIARSSGSAPPSPRPPSPPALSVSPTFVPEQGFPDLDEGLTIECEGLSGPLTCDEQCAGCLSLQSENASLRQAEEDALARIGMLEAEVQHLRSQPLDGGSAAEADTCAPTDVEDSALVTESLITHAPLPPQTARAQDRQVFVRGLPCSGIATKAVFQSAFNRFCCDRLHIRGGLSLRVMNVLTSRPGTAAGVLMLDSQGDYEALLAATREHLTDACSVSIEPNRTRAEREARSDARRARRAGTPQQRAGAAGGRLNSALHLPTQSTLRHDAPEFVPASMSSSAQPEPPLCPNAQLAHALHQE